jgi:hypothetical protein
VGTGGASVPTIRRGVAAWGRARENYGVSGGHGRAFPALAGGSLGVADVRKLAPHVQKQRLTPCLRDFGASLVALRRRAVCPGESLG